MLESRASAEQGRLALLCGSEEEDLIRTMIGDRIAIVSATADDLPRHIEQGRLPVILVSAASVVSADLIRVAAALKSVGAPGPEIILIAGRPELATAAEILGWTNLQIIEPPVNQVSIETALLRASHSLRQSEAIGTLQRRLEQEIELRTRVEEALEEAELRYRYTVDLSRQITWSYDIATGIPTVRGTRLHELTGSSPDAPIEAIVQSFMHPGDRAECLPHIREGMQTNQATSIEFRLRASDGSYHAFVSRAVPRMDGDGNVAHWYGFIEDVTEQRAATEALRQAEERYRLAARATNDAIWDWDLRTGEIAWSEAAAAYLGNVPLESSSVGWWEEAVHPDDRPRVLRSINRAIASDKARWSAAYRLRKADGDYAYVYDRGFIIRDDYGRAIRAVGAVVDLTERRRAEAELRRTQAELIHISRVSAMGTMASTLAHELNQPLTAVTSYVRGSRRLLASMEDPAVAQVCEALEFAESGALRAGQIVRRLRELVARGTVEVGPENLARLIEDASVLAFVDEHLHGITHKIQIEPDAEWVEVDRIQIQQVLINLIRNSIQALQNSPRREITISATGSSDDMVEISVADTGSGIDESVRDALFSPFHSTKDEGMGIGLSICRTIVEAHHGRIWARDGDDGGTVFSFTLPRAEPPPGELADPAEVDPGPTL